MSARSSIGPSRNACDACPHDADNDLDQDGQTSLLEAFLAARGYTIDAPVLILTRSLDAPGTPDFLGHALPALAAVDTAAIVLLMHTGGGIGSGIALAMVFISSIALLARA